ncbi:hypothetical protein HQ531_10290 [bacterium]|nr:hypothetical protein [bacterium]
MKKLLITILPFFGLAQSEIDLYVSSDNYRLSKLHLVIKSRVNASDIKGQRWNQIKREYYKKSYEQYNAQHGRRWMGGVLSIQLSDIDARSIVPFDTTYRVVEYKNSKIVSVSTVKGFYAQTDEPSGTHPHISSGYGSSLLSLVSHPNVYQISDFGEARLDTVQKDAQNMGINDKIMRTLLDDKYKLLKMKDYRTELDTTADALTLLKFMESYLEFSQININSESERLVITKCNPYANPYRSLTAISDSLNDEFTILMWTRVLQVMQVDDQIFLFCVRGSGNSGAIGYVTYIVVNGKLLKWKTDSSFAT